MGSLTFTLPVATVRLTSNSNTIVGQPQWQLDIWDSAATPNQLTMVALTSSKDDILAFAKAILDAAKGP